MSERGNPVTSGRVFEIQRFTIHDGPGIRTTVFMQGCALRCIWCHNPEGVGSRPLLSFQPDKCIVCGNCVRTCPQGAHRMVEGRHILDREVCQVCGTCTTECYARALEMVGREMAVEDVLEEVLLDRPFYQSSGGGMTVSGGEPVQQIGFTATLLEAAKAEGLHCCIETCGFGSYSRFERILPHVDLFLFDIKEMDDVRHVEYTGVSNGPILRNLRALHDAGAQILLRLPTIPGYNDREDHFAAVAALVQSLPNLCGAELMPYHRLGTSKFERLGLAPTRRVDRAPPDEKEVSRWIDQYEALGLRLLNRPAEQRPNRLSQTAPTDREMPVARPGRKRR